MKKQSIKTRQKQAAEKERGTVNLLATEPNVSSEANKAVGAHDGPLRQLSGRLLKSRDEERRRIARDLHDITGQRLAIQSMVLSQMLNGKGAALDLEMQRLLTDCDALNKQVSEDIRALSYRLHPPLLDELGLSSAVKWHVERFELRTGIRVAIEINPEIMRLPPDLEMALFRIIQESLTNVHRYSGSPTAFVRVTLAGDEIEVKIGDFGRGIDRNIFNSTSGLAGWPGLGIQGMKARAQQLNGKLELISQAKKGTVITATLPFSRPLAAVPSEPDKAH